MAKPEGLGRGEFQEWVGEQAHVVHDALSNVPGTEDAQVALAGLANQAVALRKKLHEAEKELHRVREELRNTKKSSLENEVTGLPNKRALRRQRLWSVRDAVDPKGVELKRAEDSRRPWGWACVFVDLDQFKPINDRYGHNQGDRLLYYVAQALLRTVRDTDELYHPSGDEFVIFSQISSHKQALDMTASIRERFLEQIVLIRSGKLVDELPPDYARLTPVDHESLGMIDATFGMHWSEGALVNRSEMYEIADQEMRAAKVGRTDR